MTSYAVVLPCGLILGRMNYVVRDWWATTPEGVKINALEWRAEQSHAKRSLVMVPGGTGNAWAGEVLGHTAIRGLLNARSVVALSRRGMGLSDAPSAGYTPSHFADDLEAIASVAKPEPYVLFGHSMGVPIVLEYALRKPKGMTALVLGDALAAYLDFAAAGTFNTFLEEGALEFASWDDAFDRIGRGDRWRFDRAAHRVLRQDETGRVHALIDHGALEHMVEESRAATKTYWARLGDIDVPVVLLLGASGQSPLTQEQLAQYREALPSLQILQLPGGHDLGLDGNVGPLCDALNMVLSR